MNVKRCVSVQTRVLGNSNALFKMAKMLLTLKNLFIFFVCYNRNKFKLAVIYCFIYHCLSVSRKWINHLCC